MVVALFVIVFLCRVVKFLILAVEILSPYPTNFNEDKRGTRPWGDVNRSIDEDRAGRKDRSSSHRSVQTSKQS